MKTTDEKLASATSEIRRLKKKLKASEHLLQTKQKQISEEHGKLQANMKFIAYFLKKSGGETKIPYQELKEAETEKVAMKFGEENTIIAKYDE